jgi:preprotein translocase subunit SecG
MIVLLFVIHVAIAVALVGIVLLQKSEGGALGMGGGGMSGFMTGRSTGNLLTKVTMILATAFFLTSIALVWLSNTSHAPRSLIEQGPPPSTQETPTPPPAAPTPPGSQEAPTPPPPAAPSTPPEPSTPPAR